MVESVETLAQFDWNFDNVPDRELAACCYWEYARESAFIRDVRSRAIRSWQAEGLGDRRLSADLGKLYNSGPTVEILLRGFNFRFFRNVLGICHWLEWAWDDSTAGGASWGSTAAPCSF